MPFDEDPTGGGGGGPCEACEGKGYMLSLVVNETHHAVQALPCPMCRAGDEFARRAAMAATEIRQAMKGSDGPVVDLPDGAEAPDEMAAYVLRQIFGHDPRKGGEADGDD